MFITHVNRFCVKHAKTAGLVIAVIIVLPFVFFYGPGRSTWGRGQGDRRVREVGSMYGKEIDPDEFLDQMTASDVSTFVRWRMSYSSDNRYFQMWINDTLRRIRGIHEAKTRGLDDVSDEEVAATIQEMNLFMDQKTKRFSKELFIQYKDNVLSRRGMSVERFDQMVRENIMIERLEAEATAGVFVSPAEVRAEFDQSEEEFVIKYANVHSSDMMKEESIDPNDEEIQAYFDAHREELPLPDQKRIRAVVFPLSAHAKEAEATEEEQKKYYEDNKERYERQNKTYEKAKAQIGFELRRRKMADAARGNADAFCAKLAEARQAAPEKAAADVFSEVAEEMELTVKESGPFGKDGPIPNLGPCRIFKHRAYAVTDADPYTDPVRDGETFYVGALIETIAGEVPTEADKATKQRIVDILTAEKAKAYYQENVEPLREKLAGKTPEDLKTEHQREVSADDNIAPEDKRDTVDAFDQQVDDFLVPYFEPVKKQVVTVEFKHDAINAEVTDDEVKTYYEAHPEEYAKEEVKARHILLKTEGMDEEKKAELKKKLENIRKQVVDGADFATLAKAHSEDTGSGAKGGDLGYFGKGAMVPPFEKAAFAMEPGGLSEIVESRFGYHLIKVEDKRSGRQLDDVEKEIRDKLLGEKAKEEARKQAMGFADIAYEKLDKGGYEPPMPGDDETTSTRPGKTAAQFFREAATEKGLAVIETGMFKDTGMVPKIGFEREFAQTAHRVTAHHPLSELIEGKNATYVACWLATEDAYLPKLGDDELRLALAKPTTGLRAGEDPSYQARLLLNRVKARMKREAALDMARARAQEVHETIKQKLADGVAFEEATKDLAAVKFMEAAPFKGRRPPPGVPEGAKVLKAIESAGNGDLLPPIEADSGAVVVYLVSRTLPGDDTFEKEKERFSSMLQRRKEGEARRALYERLEEESATVLARAWGGKGDEEEK